MFWARYDAIRTVVELGLDWSDYPMEPLAQDGTILHALERILPLVVKDRSYSIATTFVAGVTR